MFYYYGRKKQIAKEYPKPKFGHIVEPFAGAAAYSLYKDNWENEVTLVEINQGIVNLWLYLQAASVGDIASLPDVKEGDLLENFNLSIDERLLLSLHIRPGAVSIRNKVGRFSRWSAGKRYIIKNLYKVKHWNINQGSYEFVPNQKATWFIDPPYKDAGKHYKDFKVDYICLASFVQERKGLVIACEGPNANYLPFQPLTTVNNGGMNLSKKSQEYVYTRGL